MQWAFLDLKLDDARKSMQAFRLMHALFLALSKMKVKRSGNLVKPEGLFSVITISN